MLHGQKIIVVLPAYRAEKTLEATYRAIPLDIVDEVLLVDDFSPDETVKLSRRLGIRTIVHGENRGYGGNQKTCYEAALDLDADIVVMLHPDYQYDPRLVTPMAAMIASGVYDVVLGSRILGDTARSGGMPLYKYVANRCLTAFQNLLMGTKFSEFHTGYRAFHRKVLRRAALKANSDDFLFDNQILAQVVALGFSVGEISCPTSYFPEASSINFFRSVTYGLGVVMTSLRYRLWKIGLTRPRLFSEDPALRLTQMRPSPSSDAHFRAS